MKELETLIPLVRGNMLESIIILLVVGFLFLLSYKNLKLVQVIYNWLTSILWFLKKDYVIFANFTKKEESISEVKNQYVELGYCAYKLDDREMFNSDGSIEIETLESIVRKNRNKIRKSKKRMKRNDSFVYLGFPHVPIGFLNGYQFTDTGSVILHEYDGGNKETKAKGYFELEKIYNTEIEIIDTTSSNEKFDQSVAIKIEQSFPINDDDIVDVLGETQIIKFGIKTPMRWSINNYAQVDLYQKKFEALLNKLNEQSVKNVHLFATTPTSLSFSLGRVINHYNPDIVVYNYCNGKFDWGINLKSGKIVEIS